MVVAVIVPEKPAAHVQLLGKLRPVLLAGQFTAEQEDEKNGDVVMGITVPLKPAPHVQLLGTFSPVLLPGQLTGLHTPV